MCCLKEYLMSGCNQFYQFETTKIKSHRFIDMYLISEENKIKIKW